MLLTLPTGHEECVFTKIPEIFLLHFPMETRKAFWRKIQRIFCSYSPLRMRSAFGKKSEHFFEKLSSHFTTEDLRAVWAKKRKTFFEKFSVPTTYWRLIPGLAENFGNFLFSTPLWRWEKRFDEGFRNYRLTLPNGHEKCVWAKKSETLFKNFCSHSLLEARCPSGPLCGKFFFFTYMGEMSTP